jgi:hypothetical protein
VLEDSFLRTARLLAPFVAGVLLLDSKELLRSDCALAIESWTRLFSDSELLSPIWLLSGAVDMESLLFLFSNFEGSIAVSPVFGDESRVSCAKCSCR